MKRLTDAIDVSLLCVFKNASQERLSSATAELSKLLPAGIRWSVTPEAFNSLILHKLAEDNSATLKSWREASFGIDGKITDRELVQSLATEAVSHFGFTKFSLGVSGVLFGGHGEDGDVFELFDGWRFVVSKYNAKGLEQPTKLFSCTFECEFPAFGAPSSPTIVQHCAERFRVVLALLWLNGCAHAHTQNPARSSRSSFAPCSITTPTGTTSPVVLGLVDLPAQALASHCIVLVNNGRSSIEPVVLAWQLLERLTPQIRQQVNKAIHFLTQAFASTSTEDKIVSICIAFECLLGWALESGQEANKSEGLPKDFDGKFVKSRMIDRAVFLVGGATAKRQENARTVRDLYTERSALVHGSRTRLDKEKATQIIKKAEPLFSRCLYEILARFSETQDSSNQKTTSEPRPMQ